MNKVVLIGRITRDPEIKYTPSGKACLGFTIAVNREFRDNNGEIQSDFISCMAWGSQAEYISKYVKKGYMLGVGGRIQTRQYQAPDGQTKYTLYDSEKQNTGIEVTILKESDTTYKSASIKEYIDFMF